MQGHRAIDLSTIAQRSALIQCRSGYSHKFQTACNTTLAYRCLPIISTLPSRISPDCGNTLCLTRTSLVAAANIQRPCISPADRPGLLPGIESCYFWSVPDIEVSSAMPYCFRRFHNVVRDMPSFSAAMLLLPPASASAARISSFSRSAAELR